MLRLQNIAIRVIPLDNNHIIKFLENLIELKRDEVSLSVTG